MSGLFDRLQQEVDKAREDQGMRPADLLTLPPPQRRLMRLLLREVQLSYPEIIVAIAKLPVQQQLETAVLDDALTQLTQAGWLIRMGQAELITYRVDLRRKPSSKVASGVWGKLNKRLKEQKDKRQR